MNSRTILSSVMAASIAALALLSGCGAGGGAGSISAPSAATRSGSLAISVKWPTRAAGRLIPDRTQVVQVSVTDAMNNTQSVPIPRPAGQASVTGTTINNVAPGSATVTATAFPDMDGAGNGKGIALASVTLPVTAVANQTITVTPVTMASTITHLVIAPNPVTIPTGQTTQVAATAFDATNTAVMTNPAQFKWTITGTSTVTSLANPATVTAANSAGMATLTALEQESGKSDQAVVNITTALPDANFLIGDGQNNRVVSLDALPPTANGSVTLAASGGIGFGNPSSVAFDSKDNIYIADYPMRLLRVADMTGASPTEFHPGFSASTIYVDAADRIYFRDDNFFINRMDDMKGTNRVMFTKGGLVFGAPNSIYADVKTKMDQGPIYIADSSNNLIVRVDDMTGSNQMLFGSQGSTVNHFNLRGDGLNGATHAIAVDSLHRIYVADYGNSRIVRFDDMNGLNWKEFAVPNSGGSTKPLCVAVKGMGPQTIYFTTADAVISMTDMNGTGLVKYGTSGSGPGQFLTAFGLAVK